MFIFIKPVRNACLFLIVLFFISFKWKNEDFSRQVASKLAFFYANFPQEKVFLHLDRPYYLGGDTLWFKAYLVEGTTHIADSISQVLYVDLIEENTGQILEIKRIKLENGTGHGDFILPKSISNSSFTIRAYTNWMRNFSHYFFYKKSIALINREKHFDKEVNQEIDVQFFPEGGQVLSGVNCRIAFKATSSDGLGVDIKGFVLDQNNDTITSIKSEHLGIGRFQMKPYKNNKYRIYIAANAQDWKLYPFPNISINNYALMVDNTSSTETMRVLIYHNIEDGKEKGVSLVAHSRGQIEFSAEKAISNKGLMINIPKNIFNDGIIHLTLFDEKHQPVCERLVFIDHEQKLNVVVKPEKLNYKTREKVRVEVIITNLLGHPVESNFSVSVTDGGQIAQAVYEEDAVAWLRLTSDLKGFVEQPSYYFDHSNPLRKIYLDYLMMSQGWSRFRWNDVLTDSIKSPLFDLEQGIALRGQVMRNNKTINNKTAFSFFFESKDNKRIFTPSTDEKGFFKLGNLVFIDSASIRLQGTSSRVDQNLSFIIQQFEPPKVDKEELKLNNKSVDLLKSMKLLESSEADYQLLKKLKNNTTQQLNEITIRSKKNQVNASSKLYSSADVTLNVTPQMASLAISVMDLIKGKVAGVEVTGSESSASVSIRGSSGEPLFLLDGLPGGKELINSVNVNDVDYIDVLKGASAAIYGSRAGNGVIAVYTKNGIASIQAPLGANRGVLTMKIAGFNSSKEFYSPKYQVESNYFADHRSTIFWGPMLKTGKDGKAFFDYYNSDSMNKVIINLQTISPLGIPGSAKMEYLVR